MLLMSAKVVLASCATDNGLQQASAFRFRYDDHGRSEVRALANDCLHICAASMMSSSWYVMQASRVPTCCIAAAALVHG
jgi:hypothetical protein